mmetsp:Transcript_7770/g.14072  ORF Transcript_7770/g.14072 Transcript_7770/m.14072 type:complete len:342 (+) Transcript_7770:170-1195(+)|eukprot:CAMPEP_0201602294 /NCGR_PEP_ID=MMETSP0492-20130828/3069_1 /ASSEMBLY_ACC=CAM_ASM_000837 /TAXON_ID=420259 /ORGANISM="Thalassiosira gravida, Strain GMp14c1" /LENGTH=341 /DNA_ID=CAMNT_0048065773 /DNA_START=80 /DNA_END=1105 /DNA_ORIENTATION=+
MPESNTSGPPPVNPVATAYESYVRDTPLVTRYVLNSIIISFFAGFFFSPAYIFANIPIFTIFKFQLYRIVTSPLICTDILSLFFAFMGFLNHGVKLEQSMGSSMFAVLFFTLTIWTNILFLIISILLWGLTNSDSYLAGASMGIWTVLLGIIAVECSECPRDTKRRLFFLEVAALHYPLVLLALFSLFAGPQLAYVLAVAVGYAYGFGKLDRWKVKVETVRNWENRDQGGCLSGFVNRVGFITLGMASGPNAWLTGSGGNDGGNSGGGPAPVRAPSDPAASTTPSFPTTGGRSLGGSSRSGGLLSRGSKNPKTHEERAALLERAAERRRQQQADAEGDPGV